MVVSGMIIIGVSTIDTKPWQSDLHFKGIAIALAVALIISIYHLVDGAAVKKGPPMPALRDDHVQLVPVLTTHITTSADMDGPRFIQAWNRPGIPYYLLAAVCLVCSLIYCAVVAYHCTAQLFGRDP